jgi:uncharacterized protein with PQ loop repeat
VLTLITVAVGSTAALIGSVQFIPQVIHTIRQRHDAHALAGVSIPTFAMIALATTLWLTYGILKRDPVLIAPNVIAATGTGIVLAITLRARRRSDTHAAPTQDTDQRATR